MHRILRTCAIVLFGVGLALAERAGAADAASLIVKLRSDGAHAVHACAETRARQKRPLADATADRSDSLDAVMQRYGSGRVRALFRRPDGRSLAVQERVLRERFAATRARRSKRAPAVARRADAGTLAHVYRMELQPGARMDEARAAFAADPHVEYVQPNYSIEFDRTLDDPFLASTGSWGQPFADLWGIERIGLPAAWDRTLGEGSVIAVVDTGIESSHPDIVENLWVHPGEDLDGDGIADPEERNGIDDDGNGFVDDLVGFDFHHSVDANEDGDYDDPEDVSDPDPSDGNGHGTHVSGTAAARGDNEIGIAGVAPRARIMPVKIFPDGVGSATTENAWRGVLYAAENGADVINASWSCSPRCPTNPLGEEVARLVHELGVVFVTSAGNRSDDAAFTSPERIPETLVVAAGAPGGDLARSSSFGWVVDLVAPGEGILSLRLEDPRIWSPNRFVGDAYMWLGGTSMAAPHVTGVVALMLAADPTLGVDEIRARLRRNAEDTGPPGPDRRFGHGWVRADRALLDTARPDARAYFEAALIGARLDPEAERVAIGGTIEGSDVTGAVLAFGAGFEPDVWQTIAPLAGGEFVQPWDVSDLGDGPYVLRLTVETSRGASFTEYAPVSFDRNPPTFVSPAGTPAVQPDVAGERVVWSARRISRGPFVSDLDLQQGRFGLEGGSFLDSGIGDQTRVSASTRALVWNDRPPDAGLNDWNGLVGCALRGASSCVPTRLPADPSRIRSQPALFGSTFVYAEQTSGSFELLLCRLSARPCVPRPIAPLVSFNPEPLFDGRHVVFNALASGGGSRLFTCRVPPRGRRCVPQATDASHSSHLVPRAYADGILLYEDIDIFAGFPFEYRLFGCILDPATGACPALQIATSSDPFEVDLSQGRLVWSTSAEDGSLDLVLCRFEAGREDCPIQRLTTDPSRQAGARIDAHRVVWEDDREGEIRIASLPLPTLAPLASRRARVGRVLSFALRETTRRENVQFEGRTEAGAPVESIGMLLRETTPGRLHVSWRPRKSDVGTHRFYFRASLPGGLHDERVMQVEVLPRAGFR